MNIRKRRQKYIWTVEARYAWLDMIVGQDWPKPPVDQQVWGFVLFDRWFLVRQYRVIRLGNWVTRTEYAYIWGKIRREAS